MSYNNNFRGPPGFGGNQDAGGSPTGQGFKGPGGWGAGGLGGQGAGGYHLAAGAQGTREIGGGNHGVGSLYGGHGAVVGNYPGGGVQDARGSPTGEGFLQGAGGLRGQGAGGLRGQGAGGHHLAVGVQRPGTQETHGGNHGVARLYEAGGYHGAKVGKYQGGGALGGVGGGGVWQGAEPTVGYHGGYQGGLGGGWVGGEPQQNVQRVLDDNRILESKSKMLSEENNRLRYENTQMIRRIRSQTEEVKSVRSQLESVRKEITMLKDFSDGNQDDLIALRSETSRRSLEYEGQILKLNESEKKWRLKVQQLKKERFSDKFEQKEKDLEINVEKLQAEDKEENGRKMNEKKAEIVPVTHQFKFKEIQRNLMEEKPTIGEESSKMVSGSKDSKTRPTVKLSQRQKQISFLKSQNKLSAAENIKLDNLREQEEVWNKLDMEESIGEVKLSSKKTVSKPGVKKPKQEEVNAHHEKEELPESSPHDGALGDDKKLKVQVSLHEKYPDPDHMKQLKSLPLRTDPIFATVPDSIPISKNRQLSILFHSGKDAEKLIKLIQATPEEYKILTGRSLEEVVMTDGRVDSIDDLSIHTKSDSWIKQLGGVYNKITAFVEENPEFRLFDWLNASSSDLDFVLGFFITSLVPTADKRALGTRYTPDSLKQLKTGLQNLMKHFLKRSEKLDDFTFFMGLYIAKRNKYAVVPQDNVQGDRKRKFIKSTDQELRDTFLTKPVDDLSEPEDLLLIVGTALLEADVSRGTAVLGQIRRSFISIKADEEGEHFIAVKGNVRRKTNNGNSKKFKPMNFKIRGKLEVKAIRKLLDTLPSVGCFSCTLATPARTVGENSNCACDHLFLRQRELLHWRKTDKVWFARQKWSDSKLNQLTAVVSKKSGTTKVYTNGSIRPTNMTGMTMTGLSSDQLAHSFGLQQNFGQQEKYKRLGELMDDDQKRMATMVNTASGRDYLRGGTNKFGSVRQKENQKPNIFKRLKGLMEGLEEGKPVMEEEEVEEEESDCDVSEVGMEQNDIKVGEGVEEDNEEKVVKGLDGKPEVKSVGPVNQADKSKENNHNVGEKVFGKIFGFPPWPAEVTETNSQSGKSTVVFVDGLLGKDATTLTFNEENFKKLVKTNKFKKSGKGSKARFLADCNCWGLSFQK